MLTCTLEDKPKKFTYQLTEWIGKEELSPFTKPFYDHEDTKSGIIAKNKNKYAIFTDSTKKA